MQITRLLFFLFDSQPDIFEAFLGRSIGDCLLKNIQSTFYTLVKEQITYSRIYVASARRLYRVAKATQAERMCHPSQTRMHICIGVSLQDST